jgi:hypothetical protein
MGGVAIVSSIIWILGFGSQKFSGNSAQSAPKWLSYICLHPRSDGRLAVWPTVMQIEAYLLTPVIYVLSMVNISLSLKGIVFFVFFWTSAFLIVLIFRNRG